MLTVKEYSELTEKSPKTVRRLINQGKLNAIKIGRDLIIGGTLDDNILNTTEVGIIIGRTRARVIQLINEGKLKATRVGRDYFIDLPSLKKLTLTKPSGRPPKEE